MIRYKGYFSRQTFDTVAMISPRLRSPRCPRSPSLVRASLLRLSRLVLPFPRALLPPLPLGRLDLALQGDAEKDHGGRDQTGLAKCG
jgi:hypothetical protein